MLYHIYIARLLPDFITMVMPKNKKGGQGISITKIISCHSHFRMFALMETVDKMAKPTESVDENKNYTHRRSKILAGKLPLASGNELGNFQGRDRTRSYQSLSWTGLFPYCSAVDTKMKCTYDHWVRWKMYW